MRPVTTAPEEVFPAWLADYHPDEERDPDDQQQDGDG
jgi:hypothetical protein